MDVELKHHYGWKRYSNEASSLGAAAMHAIRKTHGFLTDSNHSMEVSTRQIEWGGKETSYSSVRVYRGEGAPAFSGPRWAETPYWFAIEYRAPRHEASQSAQAKAVAWCPVCAANQPHHTDHDSSGCLHLCDVCNNVVEY